MFKTNYDEQPLMLCQVLEQEYRHLFGDKALPAGYPQFAYGDLENTPPAAHDQEPLNDAPEDLIYKLKQAQTRRGNDNAKDHYQFLVEQLSSKFLEEVKNFTPHPSTMEKFIQELEKEIQHIQQPCFSRDYLRRDEPEIRIQKLQEALAEQRDIYGYLVVRFSCDLLERVSTFDPQKVPIEDFYQELREAINNVRLKELYKHASKQKIAALCFSGGGIRSATFALGVLQGLARHKLFDSFDYLSTVSGGGYIGSWLTAWFHNANKHHPNGGDNGTLQVISQLAKSQTNTFSPLDPEPREVRHLREYSNYLSPKLGIVSADTWTLVATIARNLLLNWFVIIPILLVVLALPRFLAPILQLNIETYPDWPNNIFWAGRILAILAIAYMGFNIPVATSPEKLAQEDSNMRWFRSQRGFWICCWLPLLLSSLCFAIYWAWFRRLSPGDDDIPGIWDFIRFGIKLYFAGWILCNAVLLLYDYKYWFKNILVKLCEVAIVTFTGGTGGYLLWVVAKQIFHTPGKDLLVYICFAPPLFLVAFSLATMFYVGVASRVTDEEDREWLSRFGGWLLIAVLGWSVLSVLVIFGPVWILWGEAKGIALVSSAGGLAGFLTIVLGRSEKTLALLKGKNSDTKSALASKWTLSLAAPIFILFLLASLSLATDGLLLLTKRILFKIDLFTINSDWRLGQFKDSLSTYEDHIHILLNSSFRFVLFLIIVLGIIGLIMSIFVSINEFSLHAMYRNRLIRGYLGASNQYRKPHPFTGFDFNDDIAMHDINVQRPLHIVNMALNLSSSENLAWQQRKAESFTVSKLHCGGYRVGYREAENYAIKGVYRLRAWLRKIPIIGQYFSINERDRGVSLGTAVAISGAAVSPNMGYHSSPIVAFILTLFNARLGWWLSNPGQDGYKKAAPGLAVLPIFKEALALTNDKESFVYLSDGGHFENLGLYEMVLRRCKYIVVSDAGQDSDSAFEDLGNALRKIRIDLGINIHMEKICIYSRKSIQEDKSLKGKYCSIGSIRYSELDKEQEDGVLIYVKPAFYGDETADIFNYAKSSETFPHETTADQFFTESQFESYRTLGVQTIEQICGDDWETKTQGMRGKKLLNAFSKSTCDYLSGCIFSDIEYFKDDTLLPNAPDESLLSPE
jgi:hypothetical protein